jgi:hypothetical protein
MKVMNRSGEELRAPGTAMVGGCHLAGKPLKPFADLHEVARLFSVRSQGRISCQLRMRSGRKAVTEERTNIVPLLRPGKGLVAFLLRHLLLECHNLPWCAGADLPTSGRNATLRFFPPMHRIGDLSERIAFSTAGVAGGQHTTTFRG